MKWQTTPVLILLSIATVIGGAQSPTGSSAPVAAPQVRPAFPEQQLPESKVQDSASREKARADEARREAQAQEEARWARETLARGYWVDPSTGLMWAGKDNGRDLSWKGAVKYCRDLRLAGYSDWGLATIDELQGIYDNSAYASRHARKGVEYILAGRAKGGLLLTGNHHWSNSKAKDDRGHSNGYAWLFDFPHGRRDWDPFGYHGSKRALCMRGSTK